MSWILPPIKQERERDFLFIKCLVGVKKANIILSSPKLCERVKSCDFCVKEEQCRAKEIDQSAETHTMKGLYDP